MKDHHDECINENCLCSYNSHGIKIPTLKDGVKVDFSKPIEQSFIQEWNESNRPDKHDQVKKDKDIIDKTSSLIKESHNFVTVRKTNEILLYNGKIYDRSNAENIIKEETEIIVENCTTHERNEVINKIKAQTGADIEEFDKDSNLITLENGILDFKNFQLKEHSPKFLSRVLLPVEFEKPKYEIKDETIFKNIEKNLEETLFWKYLKSSFVIDEDFRKDEFEAALEVTASFLIKHQIDERAFMFLGRGENGKSVLLEYIESLLGKDNLSHIQLHDISEDKFMSAKLEGKLGNIFADLEADELRHTGKIKAITSGEGIEVQRKYQEAFTLRPFSKLLFSCNRFPKVYDQSQGFFRRWIIVKWERDFENDPQRDEQLKNKLNSNQEEKNKVFSCLVYLAKKLLKGGKFTHSKEWRIIQKEWNSNADPIDDFVNNYIIDSDENKTVRETYHFYKDIMLSKQETPLGIGQFGKVFREYFDQDRIKEGGKTDRVWLNINFKEPIQTTMKEFDKR